MRQYLAGIDAASCADGPKDVGPFVALVTRPRRAAATLRHHPAVAAATVVGVPHPKWGERRTPVVVLRAGQASAESELIEFVKRHKGAVMAPKTVAIAPTLPLTGLGKTDKKALRAPFWAAQARSIGWRGCINCLPGCAWLSHDLHATPGQHQHGQGGGGRGTGLSARGEGSLCGRDGARREGGHGARGGGAASLARLRMGRVHRRKAVSDIAASIDDGLVALKDAFSEVVLAQLVTESFDWRLFRSNRLY